MTGNRSGLAAALLALAAAGALGAQEVPPRTGPALGPFIDCEATGPDSDDDGLGDACELSLARAFAPLLVVRAGGCNWEGAAADGRLGGGYLFAAQPTSDGAVRLVYLPAYFRDCGWSGPKCLLPWVSCAGHPGDSELIMVDVARVSGDAWGAEGVFLSAHCFGRSGGDCRWYRGGELNGFEWVDGRLAGAPVVWVAEGRQANYPSRRACDRGHHGLDTCDRHDTWYRFPVESERNIGSRARPIHGSGCIEGREVSAGDGAGADALECVWSEERPFRGWSGEGAGVTSYARYLREIAGFTPWTTR